MAEVVVKVHIPSTLKDRFEPALAKVVRDFVRRLEFSIAEDIGFKSKLSDKQADKLADELKRRVAKRHGL